MSSYFTLELDTKAPANPTLIINGGASLTGVQPVVVQLSSTDFGGGANDVSLMKLWGDVDPDSNPDIQVLEDESAWQNFAATLSVRLSAGNGRKHIYARLRDDVCNETVVFSDFIDLDTDAPVVSITTPVDNDKISRVSPCDTATFAWQASASFVEYQVRVVPSIGSPSVAGVVIPSTAGSSHTSGSGSFPATTPITTVIKGTDLATASPGDTPKIIKVFVRTSGGTWSA